MKAQSRVQAGGREDSIMVIGMEPVGGPPP